MRITKPIRGLYFEQIRYNATIRVSLVNSSTGQETQLIPRTSVQRLMVYGSWGEGYYVSHVVNPSGFDNMLSGYVPLSDTVVGLDNDKYLSVDVFDNDEGVTALSRSVFLYGVEDRYIASKYIYNMQRMFLASGELEKSFGVTAAEFLVLPLRTMTVNGSFETLPLNSIQLYTSSGMSPIITRQELLLRCREANDIEFMYYKEGSSGIIPDATDRHTVCVIDLEGVTRVDVRMDTNAGGYDFNLVDVRDSNLPQATLSVDTIQRAMIREVIPVQPEGAITT